jgi:hypothetical protein
MTDEKITKYTFEKCEHSIQEYFFLMITNKSKGNFTVPPFLSVSAAA